MTIFDRDWVDEEVANALIRCLFRTIVDLKRVSNLKVLVALRTNIFEQLDFGTRTGGQEEKFRSLTLRMRWVKGELEDLLTERAKAAAERDGIEAITTIRDLLPPTNKRGNALDYILQRTLMRPRDVIAFLNECLVLASGKPRLSWEDIYHAERAYSHKRLLALRDEWKPSYPGIDKVFQLFSRAPVSMSRTEFTRLLDEAFLLPVALNFEGVRWMTDFSEPVWSGVGIKDWVELYQPIIRLLFNVGFVGCARRAGSDPVFVHEEPDFAERPSNLDATCCFSVHPAFRAALDIADGSYQG